MSYSADCGKYKKELLDLKVDLKSDFDFTDEDGDFDESTMPHFLECAIDEIQRLREEKELVELKIFDMNSRLEQEIEDVAFTWGTPAGMNK